MPNIKVDLPCVHRIPVKLSRPDRSDECGRKSISLRLSDRLRDVHVSRGQREVDRKGAALAWHVADVDFTGVRSHGLPRDRESETETRAIGPASVPEGLNRSPLCSAMPPHSSSTSTSRRPACVCAPRVTVPACGRELERVVQHVHHRRREQLGVAVNGQLRVDGQYSEKHPSILRLEHASRGYFVHERRDAEALRPLLSGGKPHLGQHAVHKILQTCQASAEYRSGTAVDGDRASFQRRGRRGARR